MSNDLTQHIYLYEYKNEARIAELQRLDQIACQNIKRLEYTIEELKEYRKRLYDHTQKIAAMESHLQLKLKRSKEFYRDNKVYYYLTIEKRYKENESMYESILSETFPGTDRHAAIKRFESLKKEYPGIEAIKEIEKSRWEK